MNLVDMAKAHLNNVSAALNDLTNQRDKIQQEIDKLVAYMREAEKLIIDNDGVDNSESE